MNVRKKGSSQEIMVIKKKKTMGDIWWCNLCRIIQIPQSCSVDLNALTAVNLLRLAGSAWCQRVFTASALIIQSEKRWHSPITVPNHVWFLPTGFHHGCSSFPEHFKHLVMGKDCTFIQMWRKCLTSDLLLQMDSKPFYMTTIFGGRRTNNKCWFLN